MIRRFNKGTEGRENLLMIIQLCYNYAFLRGRLELGLTLSSEEERRLDRLSHLLEGDPEFRVRAFRRFPLALAATLRTEQGSCRAVVLNIGAGGMFAVAETDVPQGTEVHIHLGAGDQVEYTFPCKVQWRIPGAKGVGLGLKLCAIPLEVRRGISLRACA